MNTDSFVVHVKIDDIYKDISEVIERRLDLQIMSWKRFYPKKRAIKSLV